GAARCGYAGHYAPARTERIVESSPWTGRCCSPGRLVRCCSRTANRCSSRRRPRGCSRRPRTPRTRRRRPSPTTAHRARRTTPLVRCRAGGRDPPRTGREPRRRLTGVATTDDLLDLAPGVGQRAASFRFDVLDRDGAVIGQVQPDTRSVPVVENNINRAIKRDLRGLVLMPADEAAIDPVGDRIRPVMVLENGEQLAWGLFLFVDASAELYTY